MIARRIFLAFMNTKQVARFALMTALIWALASAAVEAQSVFVTGLKAPLKIAVMADGNLLVAEAGNGPNTGRISLIDRCGNRLTLLDSLPAGLAAPENEPDGPTSLALRGRTLYVLIGEGDSLRRGPAPGTAIPNPNPSSPLFSSVLAVEFSADVSRSSGGFTLAAADHTMIKNGASVALSNGRGETATIRLLVDFPDITPNPIPPFPGNVRGSHPFGVELDGNQLLLADAALNRVVRVDLSSGASSTLVTFPPIANPTPVGPPVIDPVPDGIRLFGDRLLVTILSGFPFPAGRAEVRLVDPATGNFAPFITGLTMAIDVLPVKTRTGGDQFYVLEHSTNPLAQPRGPGRLTRFDSPTGPPVVIANNLAGPVGMARDPKTGDIFVTEIGAGRITQFFGDEFDVFLKDDNNGDTLRFSALTGDYLFTSCRAGSVTLAGKGEISRSGCEIELNDPFVSATLDQCLIAPLNRGRATIRLSLFGPIFHIEGSNQAR